MPVRFNKRITIFSWLKANVGKNGISLTIGPKGKTLNVGSTGVSVNVSLGKGMGYSKRLITWKNFNILSWLGIGGAAATKAAQGKAKKGKKGTTTDLSLDEAIAEAEGKAPEATSSTPSTPSSSTASTAGDDSEANSQQDQVGCSWGCAAFGCLAMLVILALVGVIIYLLLRDGTINLGNI